MAIKQACTSPPGPTRQWKHLYLILPALKHGSITITRSLQLWEVNLSNFMAVKEVCTSSTWPAQCTAVKRVYVSFPALKPSSMIITQLLQLWKLNFRIFKVLKQACTTSTTPQWEWKWLYLPNTWYRCPWASHNLYSCEKWICGPSLQWNTPVRAPQDLHGGVNRLNWPSWCINRKLRASHKLHNSWNWVDGFPGT